MCKIHGKKIKLIPFVSPDYINGWGAQHPTPDKYSSMFKDLKVSPFKSRNTQLQTWQIGAQGMYPKVHKKWQPAWSVYKLYNFDQIPKLIKLLCIILNAKIHQREKRYKELTVKHFLSALKSRIFSRQVKLNDQRATRCTIGNIEGKHCVSENQITYCGNSKWYSLLFQTCELTNQTHKTQNPSWRGVSTFNQPQEINDSSDCDFKKPYILNGMRSNDVDFLIYGMIIFSNRADCHPMTLPQS